jgi:hypothetical protein
MAPPAFLVRGVQIVFVVLTSAMPQTSAATFPLQIPTRPTTFPLQRPALTGEVVVWGTNDYGALAIPPGLTNVVAISAAYRASAALKKDGTVVVWGDGQNALTSVPALAINSVAISLAAGHCLALKADGSVVAWGYNTGTNVPPNLTSVVAVSAGTAHSLALKSNGTVVGWGQTTVPSTLSNVVAITAGAGTSIALKEDGTLTWWDAEPRLPRSISGVVQVASATEGNLRTETLRSDGTIVQDLNGYPFAVPLNLKATAIAADIFITAAITGDGSVHAWSWQELDPSGIAKIPPRLRGVIAVAAGWNHVVALKLPTPPLPTTARASAQIVNGFIVALNILDGGEGYAEPPKVTIAGGGGSGATATAQISRGIVTGFTITNAGIGYTTQPEIAIEPPPLLPKLAIAPSRVNVTMQVVPGKRYQLESSDDLPNFSAVGAPFTPVSNTVTNEFTLSETGQFFRIQEVP